MLSNIKHKIWRSQGKEIIHFLHIGKTGGTVVKHALEPFLKHENKRILLHPHEIKLVDIPKGDKVIFFMREPISRFVSGFYSRKRKGAPRYNSPWSPEEEQAFHSFHLANDLAEAISATDAYLEEKAQNAMNHIAHVKDHYAYWLEGTEYLESRMEDVLFIGSQENLDNDFQDLLQKLGLPSEVELSTDAVLSHRNPVQDDKTLSKTAIQNLKEWYKEDQAIYDYCLSQK